MLRHGQAGLLCGQRFLPDLPGCICSTAMCGSLRCTLLPLALLMLSATFAVFACRPLHFENTNVLHQLRCGGVLEAVRISCAGFPTKTLYEDFVDHFWNLVPELLTTDHDLDDKALSKAVLKKANLQGYQCGETKVTIPLFAM